MTAWRQGSFVKAAAHLERATTCLTRSLSMFRLVGVGSSPDLLAVLWCVPSPQNWLPLWFRGGGIASRLLLYTTHSVYIIRFLGWQGLICARARPLSGRGGG